MRKNKYYKQIEFENSLKNLRNQIMYMPEEVVREEKNSLKEYAYNVELAKDSFQDLLLFYTKINKFLVFLTCSLIGLGLIATPIIIMGLISGVFATVCFCGQKRAEKDLPFWSNHLCVVNDAISDIDSFLEEKYEVLNNFDKHESKSEKVTLMNNRFFRDQIENEDDSEDNNENNNGLNL